MRRAAPRLFAAAGVLLTVLGVVVFARADLPPAVESALLRPGGAYRSDLHLTFDDAPLLWIRGHLVGLGLLVLGLLLLAALAGRGLGGRARPGVRSVRGALLLGAAGGLLVVGGIAVVLVTAPDAVVVYSGSYQPLTCAGWPDCDSAPWAAVLSGGQVVGLAAAVLGALVLAGVSGRLLSADRQVHQG